MQKVIFILVIMLSVLNTEAQTAEQKSDSKSGFYYSFFWGLIKSNNCPKNLIFDFECTKSDIFLSAPSNDIESDNVIRRSLLWGAIQWTEKKKEKALNSPNND